MPTTTRKPVGRPARKPAAAGRKPRTATHRAPAHKPEPVHHEVKHEEPKVEHAAVPKIAHGKHFYAVGRRKTSVAQVLVSGGNGTITVNQLPFEGYFQTQDLRQIVINPMSAIGVDKQLNIKGKVHGGGIHSQAESMRHAISRALIALNPESRRTLKKLGFLTRDPRVKERKKPGLKRARRAPQFSKR